MQAPPVTPSQHESTERVNEPSSITTTSERASEQFLDSIVIVCTHIVCQTNKTS